MNTTCLWKTVYMLRWKAIWEFFHDTLQFHLSSFYRIMSSTTFLAVDTLTVLVEMWNSSVKRFNCKVGCSPNAKPSMKLCGHYLANRNFAFDWFFTIDNLNTRCLRISKQTLYVKILKYCIHVTDQKMLNIKFHVFQGCLYAKCV